MFSLTATTIGSICTQGMALSVPPLRLTISAGNRLTTYPKSELANAYKLKAKDKERIYTEIYYEAKGAIPPGKQEEINNAQPIDFRELRGESSRLYERGHISRYPKIAQVQCHTPEDPWYPD